MYILQAHLDRGPPLIRSTYGDNSDLHDLMVEGLGNYVSKAYSKLNLMT